ncbi:MAG: molybdopterin dehydrogenase [Proteobacteria bacterium SG_bin9]|nr:MAG: molybdopterin dehydrogenase [Proteobacteria bacterium SG_bin9]
MSQGLTNSEFRAGGTDLSERRRSGVSRGALADLKPSPAMQSMSWDAAGAASIGASTSIAAIARDATIADAYPGLAAAAGGLATPQVRHAATIGGNLAQRSRCWYYRSPHWSCLKKGGSDCPARAGNHLYHVAFDLGPCIAPHPSTLAAALLAYDATVTTNQRQALSIPELLGDGSSGRADHLLRPDEVIEAIKLPSPLADERAIYKRAISRSYAEWPLVEIVARAVIAGGAFKFARVAIGGIAPVPLRLANVETALEGKPANTGTIEAAAKQSVQGAKPLPMTGYKLDLLQGLTHDVLEQLASSA